MWRRFLQPARTALPDSPEQLPRVPAATTWRRAGRRRSSDRPTLAKLRRRPERQRLLREQHQVDDVVRGSCLLRWPDLGGKERLVSARFLGADVDSRLVEIWRQWHGARSEGVPAPSGCLLEQSLPVL